MHGFVAFEMSLLSMMMAVLDDIDCVLITNRIGRDAIHRQLFRTGGDYRVLLRK